MESQETIQNIKDDGNMEIDDTIQDSKDDGNIERDDTMQDNKDDGNIERDDTIQDSKDDGNMELDDTIQDNKDDSNFIITEKDKVNVTLSCGLPHIWTGEEAYRLKTKFRIVGNPVGVIPRKPKHPNRIGLPFILTPEETTLILEKGFGHLIKYSNMTKPLTEQEKQDIKKLDKDLYEEQCEYSRKEMLKNLENRLDVIVDGKRRKLEKKSKVDPSILNDPESITREKVFTEECRKIRKLPENKQAVQTYLLPPNVHKMDYVNVEWNYPKTSSEILKYKVFKDLWERKYFVTTGVNFGVDFLAYPGDPLVYHAAFGVKIVNDDEELNFLTMLACARVCTHVKKTFLLASCDANDQVQYLSWRWPGK